MSAVKRYPVAIASSAWERRMANWANSRTAVIQSLTNIAATYIGTKASMRASGTVDSGPAATTNAAISASTTPRASRRCAGLGGRLEMVKACTSGAADRVFTMLSTGTTECASTAHVVCHLHEVVRLSTLRAVPPRPSNSVPRRGRAQGSSRSGRLRVRKELRRLLRDGATKKTVRVRQALGGMNDDPLDVTS